jgi:hypothetical protein
MNFSSSPGGTRRAAKWMEREMEDGEKDGGIEAKDLLPLLARRVTMSTEV